MSFKGFFKFLNSAAKLLFNRIFITGISILVQLIVLIVAIWKFNDYFVYFYTICAILSAVVVLWLINNSHTNPSYKMAWIIPIMIFPIFGGLFYLFFAGNKITPHERKKMRTLGQRTAEMLSGKEKILEEIYQISPAAGAQSRYLADCIHYPPYKNTDVEYFPLGEDMFEKYLTELRHAEKFIFLEYFIIRAGKMWDSVLEILTDKAAHGVDVRVIYDDFGCIMTLPPNYYQVLQKFNIKACSFNPVRPILSIRMNNRDHRKITVIDGNVGFTGGINLADEYINEVERFGHWKDTAIMMSGDGVWPLTVMFLSMWDYLMADSIVGDYLPYRPLPYSRLGCSDGYVQPYTDSPLDDEIVGETVYMNIITRAQKYVYITTPYLIIDNEMMTALINSAKCGIDIRIITPRISDKWYVQCVTRAHYSMLIEHGVKIYEYLPGFIHAKSYVSDDEYAVVGTINMDYRSLYLHFENAVWMYKTSCIEKIKSDFIDTMSKSELITITKNKRLALGQSLIRAILRVFAPLM